MSKTVCNIKTIKDLIEALKSAAEQLGEDTPVVLSTDEEGNAIGDILELAVSRAGGICDGDGYYFGDKDDPAIKPNESQDVLIIYPII